MGVKASESVTVSFTTQTPSTGAATDADGTPTGTFRRNGTNDGAVTVTVTNIATGDYKAAFTMPAGASEGDECELIVSATVGGVTGKAPVWRDTCVSKLPGDFNDVSQADITGGAYALDTDANGRTRIVVGTAAGEINSSSGKVPATIAAGDLANNSITAAVIATGAIDADAIAANAITDAKIATGAITSAKLAAGTITTASIADGAITMAKLGTVDGVDFVKFTSNVQAVLYGQTTIGAGQVEFLARDGATTLVTVTVDSPSGTRDSSTIA